MLISEILVFGTAGIFGFLVVTAVIQILLFRYRVRRYVDPFTRLNVLKTGDKEIGLLAGELEPVFYVRFVEELERSDIRRLEVIFGRRLIVTKAAWQKHFAGRGEAPLRPEAYYESNPLLAYYHQHPEKVKLYVKLQDVQQERHFSVGLDKVGICACVEDSHGTGSPKGGFFGKGDELFYQEWSDKFHEMVRKHDYCEELTSENALRLLNSLRVEEARE